MLAELFVAVVAGVVTDCSGVETNFVPGVVTNSTVFADPVGMLLGETFSLCSREPRSSGFGVELVAATKVIPRRIAMMDARHGLQNTWSPWGLVVGSEWDD